MCCPLAMFLFVFSLQIGYRNKGTPSRGALVCTNSSFFPPLGVPTYAFGRKKMPFCTILVLFLRTVFGGKIGGEKGAIAKGKAFGVIYLPYGKCDILLLQKEWYVANATWYIFPLGKCCGVARVSPHWNGMGFETKPFIKHSLYGSLV